MLKWCTGQDETVRVLAGWSGAPKAAAHSTPGELQMNLVSSCGLADALLVNLRYDRVRTPLWRC